MEENIPWYKQRKFQIGIAVGIVILILAGVAVAFALQPKENNQSQTEAIQSESPKSENKETKSEDKKDNSSSQSDNKNNQNAQSSSNNNSTSDNSSSDKNVYLEHADEISKSMMPDLTISEDHVDNNSYNIQDGDYTKVDDYWKYRVKGNSTEFVRLSDGYTFTVDARFGSNLDMDAHYGSDEIFTTFDTENVKMTFYLGNDSTWDDHQTSLDRRKQYNDVCYDYNGVTVYYNNLTKYTDTNIYIFDESKKLYLHIYCDDYKGEDEARQYTNLFHF